MILISLYALIFVISALFLSNNQSSFLNSTSELLQNLCLTRAKSLPSDHPEALASLVCGAPFPEGIEKSYWISAGLIHLLVVSGGHFLILFMILERICFPSKLMGLLGILYLFTTGFQPPAFRFLLGFSLHSLFLKYSKRLPSDLLVLLSGLCSLIAFPEWSQSWSLALSWIAALALAIYEELYGFQKFSFDGVRSQRAKEILFKHTLVFLILFLPLLSFQTPRPLTILMNIFLAPLLSLLLFPLGLLAMIMGFTTSIFDGIWIVTMKILAMVPMKAVEVEPSKLSLIWIWSYVFIIQMGFHFYRVRRKRVLFLLHEKKRTHE